MTQPLTDRRLLPLADALIKGQFSALSIDIFDTLLWRRVPEPKDIFVLLGHALIESGMLFNSISEVQFSQLRASAEKAARAVRESQTGSREVLLSDIYEELPPHIWTAADSRAKAIAVEVDLEAANLVLDTEIAALMDYAVGAGVRIVLTSDTYFTREQLTRFLAVAGLEKDSIPEMLFVSNEHGRPKWRDLFDLVLNDLDLAADALIHIGDNIDADVAPCATRGIAHVYYDKWVVLPRTQAHEVNLRAAEKADWLIAGGEGGLTGLRSRIAHRAPAELAPHLEPYWVYGAATLEQIQFSPDHIRRRRSSFRIRLR